MYRNNDRYANLDPHIVPKAENLHVCLDRVMPFWEDHPDPTKINMLCPYLHVATADYYHSNEAEGTMTYGPDKGQKNNYLNYHPSTNPAQLPQAAVNHLPQVLAPLMTRSKK